MVHYITPVNGKLISKLEAKYQSFKVLTQLIYMYNI